MQRGIEIGTYEQGAPEVVVEAAEPIGVANQRERTHVPSKAEMWVFCLEVRKKR